jgi:hypothetical protein
LRAHLFDSPRLAHPVCTPAIALGVGPEIFRAHEFAELADRDLMPPEMESPGKFHHVLGLLPFAAGFVFR